MERVAFLIEDSRVRLGCLLNPEALVLRRIAGIRPRRSSSGLLTGVGLSDDPLLYTGGGRTELDLDLLFDVSLAGSSITTRDVRDLTRAFWDLAENTRQSGADAGYSQPPLVRFIWGKTWNILGHVIAVAERLEYFTPDGIPRRSWLRLRMVRASERGGVQGTSRRVAVRPLQGVITLGDVVVPEDSLRVHQIIGGSLGTGLALTLSLGGAFSLAGNIIGAALANTNAARLLEAARNGISRAVQSLGARLGSLFAGEGRVGRAVRGALGRISSALAGAWAAAKEHTVRAFSAAAAAISGAARRVWGAVQGALGPLGAAIAAEVEGAVQGIRRGVAQMSQAITTAARAARAEAARIAAATAKRIDAVVGRVRSILDQATTATAELGQKLRDALSPALEDITSVLAAARLGGSIVTTAMAHTISTRLQRVAAGAEWLWSAGKAALARGLDATVKVVAQALHHITAARDTATAVHVRESTAVVQTRLSQVRDDLAALSGPPSEEQVEQLRDHLAEARAATDVVDLVAAPQTAEGSPTPAPSPWAPAWQALDVASEQLTTPQAAEAVAAIATQLDAISGAIPSVEEAQDTVLADTVKDAYAQANVDVPESTSADTTWSEEMALPPALRSEPTASRVISGQRLDQLAYEYYGDPAYWRLLALFNDIDHPLRMPTGLVLRVPPASLARRSGDVGTENDRSLQTGG